MPNEKEEKRVVLRVTLDRKTEIDMALAARQRTAQEVLEELMDAWMKDPLVLARQPAGAAIATAPYPVPEAVRPHADWHDLLERILTDSTEGQKSVLRSMLKSLAKDLRPGKRKTM